MRERLLLAFLAFASLLVGQAPASVRATLTSDYAEAGSEAVVDGVSHGWGMSQTDTATQKINVLRVAHDAPDVQFDLGLPLGHANGREQTTHQAQDAIAAGRRVVATVNGDFWQTQKPPLVSAPAGLDIRNGEVIAETSPGERGTLGFDAAGTPMIGTPTSTVSVTLPGQVVVAVDGINRMRKPDQLVVYTPRFGPRTATDATGTEVVVTTATLPITPSGSWSGTVSQIRASAGDTPIGTKQVVLSATGAATAALAGLVPGDVVTITTSIDAAWQNVRTAVGGLLLFTPDQTPDLSDPKFQESNPRTAVGITADGDLFLVTIDGRSETSGGMPLTDLVTLMRSMGAVSALNLDGGGSTTMAVDPAGDAPLALANQPSQTYERRVNTTLQIVSTATFPPTVSQPSADIVAGVTAGKSDAQVRLSWTPTITGTVTQTQLQKLGTDGQWRDVALPDEDSTDVIQRFKFGRTYQFRVRVTDSGGNTSDWSTSAAYVLRRFNESDKAVTRSGAWAIRSSSTAMGNHFARSSADGHTDNISMSVAGVQVAVVAQESPKSGVAQVTVGTTSALVDTHAGSTRPRFVLFVGSGDSISVTNAATKSRPNVDVDAFLVLTAD